MFSRVKLPLGDSSGCEVGSIEVDDVFTAIISRDMTSICTRLVTASEMMRNDE
jgi:hypothetical protein